MQLLTNALLEEYLEKDKIIAKMDRLSSRADEALTCQRWLRESSPKRLLFHRLYGDLLENRVPRRRVLDVGGGVTCFTRGFAKRHDYELVDLLAHDDPSICEQLAAEAGRDFVYPVDWNTFDNGVYDLIIANDIFPNVDQRLDLFLRRFLPKCRTMRISLTWYEEPRAYKVRRVDGEEIFFMLAWDLRQLLTVLTIYADRIVAYDLDCFRVVQPSLYSNGRQVGIIEICGGAHD